MRSYTIVLYSEPEGGYSVAVPALPGCATEGETVAEAKRMAKEAIGLHLECLADHGQRLPSDVRSFRIQLGQRGKASAYRVQVHEPVIAPTVVSLA